MYQAYLSRIVTFKGGGGGGGGGEGQGGSSAFHARSQRQSSLEHEFFSFLIFHFIEILTANLYLGF